MGFKKILIAVDSGETALHAAKKGIALANTLFAEVALIYITDISGTIVDPDSGLNAEELNLIQEHASHQIIQKYKEEFPGISVFNSLGDPRHEILRTAEKWNADLLITATHGRTGLSHLFLGSLAEALIRHSPIPVLVIPSNKE